MYMYMYVYTGLHDRVVERSRVVKFSLRSHPCCSFRRQKPRHVPRGVCVCVCVCVCAFIHILYIGGHGDPQQVCVCV